MDSCTEKDDFDFCTTIMSNADISGIGVRVAIYAQAIISMAIASFLPYHEEAFRDTSRSSYIVSTSLMIASLIELKTGKLSLFDALIVTMLTTIMTAFVTANIAYSRTLGLSINISSFLFTTFWVYWGLQVWNDPKTFGIPKGEENCTASVDTVFVVFGHNVSITNTGLRGFAMFIFAIGSISALAALWQCIKWTFLYAAGGAERAKQVAAEQYVRKLHRQRNRSGTSVQHMSFFGGAAGMIYMIVTTEQIVKRNQVVSTQDNDWSYSQTLALIMLGQQLMDCCTYIRQEVEYKKKERARANGDV